jgi:hypothetical protein
MVRAYKDAGQSSASGYNRRITGEPRRASIDRPWITREQQASNHAAEYGKINAQPKIGGQLKVRMEKAAAIVAGSLFLLTHSALSFSVICRCTGKGLAEGGKGQVTLTFDSERALAKMPTAATIQPLTEQQLADAERVTLSQLLQPPASLTGSDFSLLVLAARTSPVTVGLRPWLKKDDAANFYELGEQRGWAVNGVLHQDYGTVTTVDDDSEDLQLDLAEFTIADDLDNISATQTDDAINDDALLVFLVTAADPSQFEICTLKAIRLDSGVYKLKVRRGRFGTTPIAFTAGDAAWIVYRSDLTTYTNAKFKDYAENATAADFRLQAFTGSVEADLTDTDLCPDINFTFKDPHAPIIAWNLLQKKTTSDADFTAITWTTSYASTTKFRFAFDVQSTESRITDVELVGRLGSAQIVLTRHTFEPTRFAAVPPTVFTFPHDGTWKVFAKVTDIAGASGRRGHDARPGRVTWYELEVASVIETVLIGSAGKCQSPILDVKGGGYSGTLSGSHIMINITATCPTAGAGIALVAGLPGVDPTTLTFSAPVPFPLAISYEIGGTWPGVYQRHVLWLKATKAGLTASEIVGYEYWYDPDGPVN